MLNCGRTQNAVLTVAVVAGIYAAFKSLHLRKLGQHLGEGAAALVSGGARAFAYAMVSLRKLQRQIPEWLDGVGLVLTGQTRHLEKKKRGRGEDAGAESFRSSAILSLDLSH